MAGTVVALLAFIFLGIAGLVSPTRGEVFLLFLEFLALVVAVYVAGRLSDSAEVHGLRGPGAGISPAQVPIGGLITLAIVAAVLGSAGGVLARWQRESGERT